MTVCSCHKVQFLLLSHNLFMVAELLTFTFLQSFHSSGQIVCDCIEIKHRSDYMLTIEGDVIPVSSGV